jgi:hypothetical protein
MHKLVSHNYTVGKDNSVSEIPINVVLAGNAVPFHKYSIVAVLIFVNVMMANVVILKQIVEMVCIVRDYHRHANNANIVRSQNHHQHVKTLAVIIKPLTILPMNLQPPI